MLGRFINTAASALILLTLIAGVAAQSPDSYEAKRRAAFRLHDDSKLLEALPILETLAAEKPDDALVLERLAYSLLAKALTLTDSEAARRERVRARQLAERSRALGNNSPLVQTILDDLPADGGQLKFSDRDEVDKAMRDGEAAFAANDMDRALGAYKRALLLDPKNYEASLFIGDVYFKKREFDQAGPWFAQTIRINPDRETAYRYWGDALMLSGRMEEAREKFILAIVAEPYNRRSYVGLSQWASRTGAKLAHPAIEIPNSVKTEAGKTTINLDATSLDRKDGSQHWTIYSFMRAGYSRQFAKDHPNEEKYRHSLAEEMVALQAVVRAVSEDLKKGTQGIADQFKTLVRLNEAGLLEAFILLARADEGIALDYANYRASNRDKLQRYISEFVISKN